MPHVPDVDGKGGCKPSSRAVLGATKLYLYECATYRILGSWYCACRRCKQTRRARRHRRLQGGTAADARRARRPEVGEDAPTLPPTRDGTHAHPAASPPMCTAHVPRGVPLAPLVMYQRSSAKVGAPRHGQRKQPTHAQARTMHSWARAVQCAYAAAAPRGQTPAQDHRGRAPTCRALTCSTVAQCPNQAWLQQSSSCINPQHLHPQWPADSERASTKFTQLDQTHKTRLKAGADGL